MSHRRRLVLNVIPVEGKILPGLAAPVTIIPLEVESGRNVIVFVLSGEERKLMADDQVRVMAQALGNLAHPAQCALVVAPVGSTLTAHEIRPRRAG